jgi:hypothetical protein
MSQHLSRWMHLSQVIVQRLTMASLLLFAAAATLWCIAAAVGLAPWLRFSVGLGGAPVEAGTAVQLGFTIFVLGLCFFVPMNDQVLRLENSHRVFRVSMWDVAQAYREAHAADRDGVFELRSEFDSVRDRLEHLRRHPDLSSLEPEILEIAAQMSHESRELAEIYSSEHVDRARTFLRQRQEEAEQMRARVQAAQATCRELKRWLERVEADEQTARAEVARLRAELEELLPVLDMRPAEPRGNIEVLGHRTYAAE